MQNASKLAQPGMAPKNRHAVRRKVGWHHSRWEAAHIVLPFANRPAGQVSQKRSAKTAMHPAKDQRSRKSSVRAPQCAQCGAAAGPGRVDGAQLSWEIMLARGARSQAAGANGQGPLAAGAARAAPACSGAPVRARGSGPHAGADAVEHVGRGAAHGALGTAHDLVGLWRAGQRGSACQRHIGAAAMQAPQPAAPSSLLRGPAKQSHQAEVLAVGAVPVLL